MTNKNGWRYIHNFQHGTFWDRTSPKNKDTVTGLTCVKSITLNISARPGLH